jgi:DNA-binding NarL/FixJ family response regulator
MPTARSMCVPPISTHTPLNAWPARRTYDLRVPFVTPRGSLVGRDDELRALRAAVAAVIAGRGGLAWLEGEPGIGKSALIASAVAQAQEGHCQVYRAAGAELGQQLPLRALTDALGPRLTDEAGLLNWGDWPEHETAVPAAVERFLAMLVAEGHSNPDIAAALLLSRRTVQTHVSHILTKLGYSSRIEIAREVDRRITT